MEEFTRPEAVITSLPEGCHLTLSRVQEGYWVAAADGEEAPPEIELAVASPKRKPTFVGARAVSGPDADGTYRVRVAPGGWLAACWDRVPETVAALPLVLGEPPSGMQFVAHTGLPVFGENGGPLKNGLTGKERFLSWRAGLKGHAIQADYLLTLPKQAATLKATAVDGGGFEKATVWVRVNGTVVAEIDHAGGAKTPVSASLAAFAGQTVLLTFDARADGPFGLQDPTLVQAEQGTRR